MKIAITGTPGTGKTEVAKLLAKELGWKLVELNKLAKEKNLYSGYDKKRECEVVDLGKIEKEVLKIKGNLILESHYAHDMPADIVIVLRCDPKELRERMEKRGWSKEKIEENIEAEIMDVCKTETLEKCKQRVFEVNTTKKESEGAIQDIIEILKVNKELGK
ncbi:MAG: adenylate kinase family protein [Candidatus Aenigmarchaeota archaeon]|nr:adenylate kinase family protein [Candidatus Aenigmarchaeota archaeon]